MESVEQCNTENDAHTHEDEMSLLEDKYNMQYFGFLPQFFLNGIYNTICEYLKEAMNALNETILKKAVEAMKVTDITILNMCQGHVSETHLEEVSNELRIKAIQRLDDKFDKAENYLINNVFKLPDHVVLQEDMAQVDTPCSQEEMAQLDEDIENTVKRIAMVKMANAVLQTRIEKIDTLQKEFDSTLDSVKNRHEEVNTQSRHVLKAVTDLGNVQKELLKIKDI